MRTGWFLLVVALGMVLSGGAWAESQEPRADRAGGVPHLPSGPVAVLKIQQLDEFIARLETSPLIDELLSLPSYQAGMQSSQFAKAQAGRKLAETFLGMDLLTLAKRLTDGEITVGFYPLKRLDKPEPVLLLQVSDGSILRELRQKAEPFLTLVDDITAEQQAGVERFTFQDKLALALGEDWLCVTTKRELLETVLTTEAGAGIAPVAALADPHLASLFVDLKLIEEKVGHRVLPAKLDNPVGSLLLGGLTELTAHSDYVATTLDVGEHDFRFAVHLPAESKQVDESHRVFFTNEAGEGTPTLPLSDQRISGFVLHRDFTQWYLGREELLEDKVLPAFDQFETNITNLLPGRNFGADVMPLMGNNLTFLAAPQDYGHLQGEPGVKLPGFAIVLELAEPEEGAQVIQLFFQTFAAILNIEAGKQGRQPWLIHSEVYQGTQLTHGEYMQKPEGDRLPIVFNFMPAAAQVGPRYVLSSSVGLCRQLIDEYQNQPEKVRVQGGRDFNFELEIAPLATALEANASLLHANAVKEGKTLEDAQAELEIALQMLRRLQHLQLTTGAAETGYELQLTGAWE